MRMVANSSHLRETVFNVHPERLDITFAQMVLVMKLTMFAWNVHDGRRKPEVSCLP